MLDVLFVCWTAGNDVIGDEGIIRIVEGLEKNTSLMELYFHGMFLPLHSSFIVAFLISFSHDDQHGMIFDLPT